MTEVECRMTNFWDLTTDHADNTDVVEAVVFNRLRQIGSTRVPSATGRIRRGERVGRCVSRRRTFLFVSLAPGTGALPRRLRPSRRDPVGQRIGMKIGVITQTKPGTIWLGSLRYGVFLTRGKVVPGIVASDG